MKGKEDKKREEKSAKKNIKYRANTNIWVDNKKNRKYGRISLANIGMLCNNITIYPPATSTNV